ncbi:MAG: response regulator transcription factor [Microcystaceae cyanobacterium]
MANVPAGDEPDTLPTSPDLSGITPREGEVLRLIGRGATNREIAQELYISEGTVKTHVTHLLTRLELRNRAQLAIYSHSIFKDAG